MSLAIVRMGGTMTSEQIKALRRRWFGVASILDVAAAGLRAYVLSHPSALSMDQGYDGPEGLRKLADLLEGRDPR